MLTESVPPAGDERSILMVRLFSELQIARFNELYYQRRAAHYKKWASRLGIVTAIAASAALANTLGMAEELGKVVWQGVIALAAIAAAVRPVVSFDAKASQLDKAAFAHGFLRGRIAELLHDLKANSMDETHSARYREIGALKTALTALDEAPNDVMRESCWKATLEEMPSEQAWNLV